MAALTVFEPQDIEPQALNIMQPGNEMLEELVDDFCQLWHRSGSKPIACFYETQKSQIGKIVGMARRSVRLPKS